MIFLFTRLTKNKIVRYVLSGGAAALVSLGLLYFFTDIVGIWYLLSSTLAFIVAFFVSFLLQKLWTFKSAHTHDVWRQIFLYFITALLGLSANALFMYALVDIVGMWYMFAQVFSSGTIALITFFVYGNIIFNHTQKGRVLLATGLYPPDIGGPSTYSRLLEEELPKYNIGVTVVSFSRVRRMPKIIRHFVYFLRVCLEGTETETFYALDPVSVGLPTFIAAKLLRKKFLLRIVGDYAWEQFQMNQESGIRNQEFVTLEDFQKKTFDCVTEARRKIEHFVARHADTVVVPSNYLKNIVLLWGVAPEKIKVIYNSFDAPLVLGDKKNIRDRLGISGTILFSAGRLVPWKGFGALIEVVSELKKDIPDIKLYIAGDGPQESDLRFKILDLRMGDNIILLRRLSRDVLMEYVRAADIFVLNTGYEGFSHQLLEVMALGTPIVTTNIGGNLELIENQKEGLLVPYNDRKKLKGVILSLISNVALRNTLIKNGAEKVKSFSKKKSVEELIRVF